MNPTRIGQRVWWIGVDRAELRLAKGTVTVDPDIPPMIRGWGVCFKLTKREGHRDLLRVRLRKDGSDQMELSRFIMGPSDVMVVDHRNHDTLDNRRANLRVCTRSENCRNNRGRAHKKNPYKGVCHHDHRKYNPNATGDKPWRAYTRIDGRRIWLGYYKTAEEAARAYDLFALKTFGEFAMLNDPQMELQLA